MNSTCHTEMWLCLLFCLLCAAEEVASYSPHFRVTSILTEPYLMINSKYANHTGNLRYHGYIMDLMDELSELIGIGYRMSLVADGSYGFERKDGSWDGLIGELTKGRADIVAAPMYVTKERKKAVLFSEPFLDVYASVLLDKHKLDLSSPHISSARDLVQQSVFQYGTLNTGVLVHAFIHTNDTDYQKMWKTIKNNKSLFEKQNKDGIDRVRRENYAYVIPSVIADYVALQVPCDLVVIDRFLMHGEFSLAFPQDSELIDELNLCIQILRRSGKLDELYDKWWKDKSHCSGGVSIKSSYMISRNGNKTIFDMMNIVLNLVFCLSLYMIMLN